MFSLYFFFVWHRVNLGAISWCQRSELDSQDCSPTITIHWIYSFGFVSLPVDIKIRGTLLLGFRFAVGFAEA